MWPLSATHHPGFYTRNMQTGEFLELNDRHKAAAQLGLDREAPPRLSRLRGSCRLPRGQAGEGRGKPQVYEPKQATEARRRFSIETELRRALEKDQLELFYQPLINLKSGQVAGFEALARWTHEDRGEISPTEFIPVAEESGLILQLGRWAMDKAAQTLAGWDAQAGENAAAAMSRSICPRSRSRVTTFRQWSKAR